MRRVAGVIGLLALGLGLSAPTEATTTGGDAATRPRRVTEGTLLWRASGEAAAVPAPLLRTEVDLRVTGPLVRATVRQEFINSSATWAEGVYVFPLPEDAAVDHLRMWVGERVIEGVVRERATAQAAYQQARQDGRRASLVEEQRANIFTTSVANVAANAAVTVEIEYQQTVRYDAGRYRLRFPMVVAPRYVAAADAAPDPSGITPAVRDPARGPINPVDLQVDLDAGVPLARIESSYHPIHITRLGDGRYGIVLAEGSVPADRDFELVWEPLAGSEPAAVLFTESRGEDVFALLMVMPPVAAALEGAGVPREVVFVVDTSGSMHGASIAQARAALRAALGRLRPVDRFNVIQFNTVTQVLFSDARPADAHHRHLAEQYVDGLRAAGGTEMLPALLLALDGREDAGRLKQVIFLTDGAVGHEEPLFRVIRERLADGRLFTIGIGSAPNSHFMREAARLGRGTFTYIGSPLEVQDRMSALFRKIESPALTDVTLDLAGVPAAEVFPAPVPDLYAGEPVMVAFKARTLPPRLVVRGRFGLQDWERDVSVHEAAEGGGLPVHWARAKIGALLAARRAGAAEDDVRQAVVAVALTHHLVSAYTSLVAVDVTPARPADALLGSHAMDTNLPHGWDSAALAGLGQGGSAATLHLVAGLAALLAALVVAVAPGPFLARRPVIRR